jgi:hypothetical protein
VQIKTKTNADDPELYKVAPSQLNAHIKSKEDIYHILAISGQRFLPSFDETTMHFLRDCLSGRKRLFKLKEITPINLPRLREFSADRLYDIAIEDQQLAQYLPAPTDKGKRPVSRRFVFTVSYYKQCQITPCILTDR